MSELRQLQKFWIALVCYRIHVAIVGLSSQNVLLFSQIYHDIPVWSVYAPAVYYESELNASNQIQSINSPQTMPCYQHIRVRVW